MNLSPNAQGQVEDVYEEAMNAGHAAAWEQDWQNAIPAYMTAIRARPGDPTAHNNLGLALLNAGRLDDALKVYQRASKLAPDDPIPLEKCADVMEQLGQLQDAAKQYLAVADIHLGNQDMDKAIANWERATHIASGLIDIRKKLALAYEKTGRKRQAVREYLTLAYNYKKVGNTPVAIQAVERALRLEPQNPQALNALQALRSGSDIMAPQEEAPTRRPGTDDALYEDEFDLPIPVSDFDDMGESNVDGPIGEAVEQALEDLATHVMETGAIMEQSGMLIIQAIELHRQESYADAIRTYKQAQKAGLNHDGVSMTLGALSIAEGQWKDAVNNFEKVKEEAYLAGAQHGLGIACWQLNKPRDASTHLINTMKLIEIYMATSDAKVRELTHVYDGMVDGLDIADDKTLREMNERFFALLTGADWKQRIEMTRKTLEDAMKKDPSAIIDAAAVNPEVLSSMNTVDQYIESRRYHMAIEEAYYVLEKEPEFLAAHMKIGEVLVQLNRIHQAIDKYNNIARAYIARGNRLRAAEVLEEIIKAAPMDVSVRLNLIEMLEEEEQMDRLLPEYVYLADAYTELGDMTNAKETYQHAIMIARRLDAPSPVVAEIMHKVADIDMQRLDLRSASKTYEQIKSLHPNDTLARQILIDINYRLSNPLSAITELDGLLQIYAANRDGKNILKTLQKLVKERPDDEAIRSRIAAIYHQIQQIGPALQHYNYLLELQLNNGRHKEACETIKTILTLNPPQKERYQQLAGQLGCN